MNKPTSNKNKIEFIARIVNPDGQVIEKTVTSAEMINLIYHKTAYSF